MATWTFDRPAANFLGQEDTDGATTTVALANSPGDFAVSISAVDIAVEAGAVDLNGGAGDDSYGLSVRITSGGTVLASDTGGTNPQQVQALAGAGTFPKDFTAVSFNYVLTTATKTQWDAAVIEYTQSWTKLKGADNDYITIAAGTNDITVTYTAEVAPTLTLPTETNITANTATVGCTTDTAAGTLYWFVSTSATAPTAANLKNGTGAYNSQFGNIASPGIGTETFSVTGLAQSGTYYTYFVHTNGVGDSNILESGSWLTQSAITADDLESAGQITQPSIGQEHKLLADDAQSLGQVSTPLSQGEHTLLADDLQAVSSVTTPALVEDTQNELLADDLESAGQLSQPTLGLDYEVLRPDGDVTVTGWTDEGGATTNLFQSIDEDVADTADYVRSPLDPQGGTNLYQCSLADWTGPNADPDGLHRVSYQIKKDSVNSNQINLTVRLKEGVTTIATWTHTDVTGASWQLINQTLTAPQIASITNYDDCRIEFEGVEP